MSDIVSDYQIAVQQHISIYLRIASVLRSSKFVTNPFGTNKRQASHITGFCSTSVQLHYSIVSFIPMELNYFCIAFSIMPKELSSYLWWLVHWDVHNLLWNKQLVWSSRWEFSFDNTLQGNMGSYKAKLCLYIHTRMSTGILQNLRL